MAVLGPPVIGGGGGSPEPPERDPEGDEGGGDAAGAPEHESPERASEEPDREADAPDSLSETLDRVESGSRERSERDEERSEAAGEERRTVTVGDLHTALGRRTFGPLFVVAGLFAVTPVGVIPGVPTTLSVIVFVLSVQLLFGSESVWIPAFIEKRTLDAGRVEKSARLLRRVAERVDPVFRPRLTFLLEDPGVRVMAAICAAIALLIPPLEFVPFAVTLPAMAVAGFGLALLTRDGVMALVASGFAGAGFYLLIRSFF